ncbi:hypothetical protein PR202_gb13151 [Eleusine coracana subsp. coracana]|uniref:Replication factor C subunit 1 n=1 Tax=Eleusine coracana subsp. coracana TaxID=191504 RepID=A0AAV5ET18_ELECO|nr:hypothetical protein PR202_gb13151 [Eleusine coracana subsp. coracana]
MVSAFLVLSRSPGFLFRVFLIRRGWEGQFVSLFLRCWASPSWIFLAQSSDIRKWFTKAQTTNGAAAKPSGAAGDKKKPVLSIPEKKPAPTMVECWSHNLIAPCNQDPSVRKRTSKYFASKTEKDSDVEMTDAVAGKSTEKSTGKRKIQKSCKELEDDDSHLLAKKIFKDEEDDDEDFVAPSKNKTPMKPPPSKKSKVESSVEAPGNTVGIDEVEEEDRMDEVVKTPSKAAGRGRGGERGRGRGGRSAGVAPEKTVGDEGEEDRMDEDVKTPSKAAGRGRGGRGAGAAPGERGRGGGGGRGFMNFGERKDPPHKGEKEVPEGAPDCLSGLTFVISGTLDSLEREEATDLIKRYGGRVTGSISKKTSYLLADEDIGGVKSNKAKELGVPFLTENGLFDLIRKSKPANASVDKRQSSNSEKLQKSQTKSSPAKVEKRGRSELNFQCFYSFLLALTPTVQFSFLLTKSKAEGSAVDKSTISKSNVAIASASGDNQKVKSIDRGSMQWTEKYRPKVPNDIVGNQSNVKQLHDWLKSWDAQFLHPNQKGKRKKLADSGAKKAVLLSGPPGIGKTTTAKVVNASDSRGKADSKIEKGVGGSTSNSIKELISNATLSYSDNRSKHPKAVLIMDEVDGMSAGDRGGVADLIASINISKIPIICICNDRYSQKLKSLVNYCLLLNFRKPTKQQVISCHISF